MANLKRAEFEVFLGSPVVARVTFNVLASVERVTGTRVSAAIQSGALGMGEFQQIVFHAGRVKVGGLTLKASNNYLEHDDNQGLYLHVIEALSGFFLWHLTDEQKEEEARQEEAGEARDEEGEVLGGKGGIGIVS